MVLNGRGFLVISGLPVERWSMRETATAYFGLGTRLSSAHLQGHVLGHVQDLGRDVQDPNVRIYQTNARQTFPYQLLRRDTSACCASRPRNRRLVGAA